MSASLRRLPALFAIALLPLVGAPAAHAFPGSWTMSGAFERSTAPSFWGGFNPNDVDRVLVQFDNRAKTLGLTLSYFEAPGRDVITVGLGLGRPDGSCNADALRVAITARDIMRTRTETVLVPYLIPGRTETRWTLANISPGRDWHSAGYDEWRRQWRWIRIVHATTGYRTETRTVTEPDPSTHARVARLERDGIDGSLEESATTLHGSTIHHWRFGSPRLDGLVADCLEIRIPGRARPYVIAPPPPPAPPEPEPAPDPLPAPEIEEPDEADEDETTATVARRSSSRVVLRLHGPTADRVQVRIGRTQRTLRYRRTLAIPRVPPRTQTLRVRTQRNGAWSPWRVVDVRPPARR